MMDISVNQQMKTAHTSIKLDEYHDFSFHSKFLKKRGIHYEMKILRRNLCTAFCNQKAATKARCAENKAVCNNFDSVPKVVVQPLCS